MKRQTSSPAEGQTSSPAVGQTTAVEKDETPVFSLAAVIVLLGILVVCGFTWVHDPYWPAMVFAAESLAGVLICTSMIMRLAGRDDALTRQFCVVGGKSDCDQVLQRGILTETISLADAGLMYFAMQFLYLWLGAATASPAAALALLSLPAVAAAALTIGLLIWQGFFIRRWCRMCLLVTGLLWVQLFSVVAFGPPLWGTVLRLPPAAGYLFALAVGVAAAWVVFKPWMVTAEQNKKVRVMLNRWRKNSDLFWTLLEGQRMAVDWQDWEDEIVLGDPQAPARLLFVLGPYCPVCARELPRLLVLLRTPGVRLGASIRFSFRQSDGRLSFAVAHILAACLAHPDAGQRMTILKDWFRQMDPETFAAKWPAQRDSRCDALLERHRQWSERNIIRTTPVYFLNGKEVPDMYKLSDVGAHLSKPRRIIQNLPI